MKFDRFMEHCFRVLCLVSALVVLFGSLVSCFSRPLIACAFSPSDPTAWAGMVDSWRDEYETNLAGTLLEINQGLASGDIDASTEAGKRYFAVQALQAFALENPNMSTILHAVDLGLQTVPDFSGIESLPDSVSVSGSFAYGLCKKTGSSDYHIVNFYPGSACIAKSDFFNLVISTTWPGDPNFRPAEWYSGTGLYGTRLTTARDYRVIVTDTMGYFSSSYNQPVYSNTYELYCYGGYYTVPIVSGSLSNYFATGSTINSALAGLAANLTLPNANIDTVQPWNYYNNIMLPYIHQNFPEITDNYLVFPNGYYPSQDPTEPHYFNPNINFNGVGVSGLAPIILGAGAIINVSGNSINVFAPVDGQIRIDGIQLQFPLDNDNTVYIDKTPYHLPTPELQIGDHLLEIISKSQLVVDGLDWLINGDGTLTIDDITFNLPIGEIETIPIDASNFVYKYEIPTMERINVVDATLSPVDLSSFADGVSGFYGLAARLYYDLGLFNPLIICLFVAAVGYAVSKIGGGH